MGFQLTIMHGYVFKAPSANKVVRCQLLELKDINSAQLPTVSNAVGQDGNFYDRNAPIK